MPQRKLGTLAEIIACGGVVSAAIAMLSANLLRERVCSFRFGLFCFGSRRADDDTHTHTHARPNARRSIDRSIDRPIDRPIDRSIDQT